MTAPETRKAYRKLPHVRKRESAYTRAWAARNPEAIMLIEARKRAKATGLEFTITREDIRIPGVCPLLGIELRRGPARGKPAPDSPAVDRIDNRLGYVPGNVWVISDRANRIKRDATLDELRLIVAGLEARRP